PHCGTLLPRPRLRGLPRVGLLRWLLFRSGRRATVLSILRLLHLRLGLLRKLLSVLWLRRLPAPLRLWIRARLRRRLRLWRLGLWRLRLRRLRLWPRFPPRGVRPPLRWPFPPVVTIDRSSCSWL